MLQLTQLPPPRRPPGAGSVDPDSRSHAPACQLPRRLRSVVHKGRPPPCPAPPPASSPRVRAAGAGGVGARHVLPVIKHARARLPAACLCRKRRAYGLNAELPDGVVHQHHAVLHTHPDVPVGPAALVRPVLVALLLRGKRANRRPVGGAFVTSPPAPAVDTGLAHRRLQGHSPRRPGRRASVSPCW